MNYMKLYPMTISDGPGVRVSLYVSGCKNHCPGCHNKASWDFGAGELFTEEILNKILDSLGLDYIKGITILGGEPMEFENQPEILKIVRKVKEKYPNKDIWIFTGYNFDDFISGGKRHSRISEEIISIIDVMVVGRFDITKRDISSRNRWRGSTNQRVIDVQATLRNNRLVPVLGIPNNEI